MKKSKIIVPALAVLLLSTAASVTGTVAWFTANQVYTMKAGQFAVVNTKNNLEAVLGSGEGTTAAGNDVTVNADSAGTGILKLTDASFDHNIANGKFVEPDANGTVIGESYDLLGNGSIASVAGGLGRETDIKSAFTWTITFKMSFSTSAQTYVGLFFDASSTDTWAHEVLKVKNGQVITAKEAGTYKPNADLSGDDVVLAADQVIAADATYYKAAPDDTGKGLRIGFFPSNIPADSYGYSRVWAPHQTTANAHYIDTAAAEPAAYSATAEYSVGDIVKQSTKYYKCKTAIALPGEEFTAAHWDELAANSLELKQVNYAGETLAVTNGTQTADTPSAVPLMDSTYHLGAPASAANRASTLSGAQNYLGYFYPKKGQTVELTYTCVAWYEGTDPEIVNTAATIYETMTTSLSFVAANLNENVA